MHRFYSFTQTRLRQTYQQTGNYLGRCQTCRYFALQTIWRSRLWCCPIRRGDWQLSSSVCRVQSGDRKHASQSSVSPTELYLSPLFRLHSYLDTDDNDQRCCYGDSKRLLVLFYHDREGSVRNEEEQERGAHPLQRAQEELALVEEKVLLAGFVQARVAKAVPVIHIL